MTKIYRPSLICAQILLGYLFIAVLMHVVFYKKSTGSALASSDKVNIALPPNIVGIVNAKDCSPKIPRYALRFEITGNTRVGYRYNERGIINSAWIIKSAGGLEAHKLLDDIAISTVMSCKVGIVNPLPFSPSGTKGIILRPLQMKAGEGSIEFSFQIEGVTAPSADFGVDHRIALPDIQAAAWRPIGSITATNRHFVYADIDKISATSVRFWLLTSSDMEKFEPSSSIRLHEIDCNSGQGKIIQATTYRLPMAVGPHMSVFSKEIVLPKSQPHSSLAQAETIACEGIKP
jgi:hypothetical protein